MGDSQELARNLKEKGNEAFKKQQFMGAIRFYTESLEHFDSPIVLSNRAQAELSSDLPLLAQMDCTASLERDPKVSKTFYRRAHAFKMMGLYELALKDLENGIKCADSPAMQKMKEELKGKKNAQVIDVPAVERGEYLQSKEEFTIISIPNTKFQDPKPSTTQPTPEPIQITSLPNPPKDYQDFAAALSMLIKDNSLLSLGEYFLTVPVKEYSRIFDELLDDVYASYIFQSINQLLKTGRRIPNLFEILISLSELSRFDLIMALMSQEHHGTISSICEFLTPIEALEVRAKFNC